MCDGLRAGCSVPKEAALGVAGVGRAAVQRGSVQLRFICDSIHRARRNFADKLSSKLLRRRADDKFFLHL